MRGARRLGAALACLVTLCAAPASAGKLDDFERATTGDGGGASRPSTPPSRTGVTRFAWRGGANADLGNDLGGALVQLLLTGMVEGSRLSLARLQGPEASSLAGVTSRLAGDADLADGAPDLARQWVDQGITAGDARLEAGYGPFALQGRYTRFREDNPPDTLSMTYVHGMIRVAPVPAFEFRTGRKHARATSQSGFSTALAATIRPIGAFDVRFAPTWTSLGQRTVEDYDLSIGFMPKHVGARLGYRWFKAGPEILRGPYVGVSLYY
ncbi:MAG: hypothetical protein U0575_00070 [Phycisphaerales bacterium]